MEEHWQEGLVEKKKSGKDELTVEDMSARSGINKGFLSGLIERGFVNKPHYTRKFAVTGVKLTPSQEERVTKHFDALKGRPGAKGTDRSLHEVALSKVVNEEKLEGRPVHYTYREKSAEEVWDQVLKNPVGRARFANPKFKTEQKNLEAGGTWYDGPKGIMPMPRNYDDVLWDKTKEKAAELEVLASMGDKDAADKYAILQAKWPFELKPLEPIRSKK